MLRFQKTKPIRGRAEDKAKWGNTSTPTPVIPLGRRGDVDTYSMRKLEDGSIQLVNYRNPLLTFSPDERITITPKYGCIMEAAFIGRVLGIKAWVDRKKIGIKDDDDDRHAIERGGRLVLDCSGCREDEDEEGQPTLRVMLKDNIFSYYVNRKAANNVRAQYSEFSNYLHGFLQLRKDVENHPHAPTHRRTWNEGDEIIRVQLSEIADCVGYEYSKYPRWGTINTIVGHEQVWKPDLRQWNFIDSKPQGTHCTTRYTRGEGDAAQIKTSWEWYESQVKAFLRLVENGQSDNIRTDNYYRATLTLLGIAAGYIHRMPPVGEDAHITIPLSRVRRLWDDILLMYYSDVMLEKREVKPNHLPNDRYNKYVTIMPKEEPKREPTMEDINFNIS